MELKRIVILSADSITSVVYQYKVSPFAVFEHMTAAQIITKSLQKQKHTQRFSS